MEPLSQALIQLAGDRATVLTLRLTRLARQKFACESAENLVKATRESVGYISSRCMELLNTPDDPTIDTTRTHETEGRLLNTFLEFLENQLLPLLEQSNISYTPPEFVAPIIRLAHEIYPDSEVLIVALRENNYRFASIGSILFNAFEQVGCNSFLSDNEVSENLRLLQFCERRAGAHG